LNDAVTPLGIPAADKLTLPLKPFCGLTVIALVPMVPCDIVKLLGDTEAQSSAERSRSEKPWCCSSSCPTNL